MSVSTRRTLLVALIAGMGCSVILAPASAADRPADALDGFRALLSDAVAYQPERSNDDDDNRGDDEDRWDDDHDDHSGDEASQHDDDDRGDNGDDAWGDNRDNGNDDGDGGDGRDNR